MPKATVSEKRSGRVWGHGAPMVAEDEGEDQGSPREAKDSGAISGCQAESSRNIFHSLVLRVGREGQRGDVELGGLGEAGTSQQGSGLESSICSGGDEAEAEWVREDERKFPSRKRGATLRGNFGGEDFAADG